MFVLCRKDAEGIVEAMKYFKETFNTLYKCNAAMSMLIQLEDADNLQKGTFYNTLS